MVGEALEGIELKQHQLRPGMSYTMTGSSAASVTANVLIDAFLGRTVVVWGDDEEAVRSRFANP